MTAKQKIILNRTTRVSERLTLVRDGRGMGGAGKPASHYLNNWCVASGIDRGNGYQGYYSVDYALSCDWVPGEAKRTIRATLGISGIDPLDLHDRLEQLEKIPQSDLTDDQRLELRAAISQAEDSQDCYTPARGGAPAIVQCAHLVNSDFDGAPDDTVIVKTSRASNFRVVRQSPGVFIVYGRAEFVGGSTIVRGIDAVRALLLTR